MAKLYFRYGAMGSGKSIDLLKVAYNYEERGHKIMCFNARIDTRNEDSKIFTRIGISKDAHLFDKETNMYDVVLTQKFLPAAVLIDESQFLSKKQVNELSDVVDYLNIPVICYGLRTDFQNNFFEGSHRLFELADKIEEIKTICKCSAKATHNARFIDGKMQVSGNQVFIGDTEYKALCRKCYKEEINKVK